MAYAMGYDDSNKINYNRDYNRSIKIRLYSVDMNGFI